MVSFYSRYCGNEGGGEPRGQPAGDGMSGCLDEAVTWPRRHCYARVEDHQSRHQPSGRKVKGRKRSTREGTTRRIRQGMSFILLFSLVRRINWPQNRLSLDTSSCKPAESASQTRTSPHSLLKKGQNLSCTSLVPRAPCLGDPKITKIGRAKPSLA